MKQRKGGTDVKGCGCSLGPGKTACSKYFSREDISTTRMNCWEMSATELDILMLATWMPQSGENSWSF